jgi:cobalt-zinc-cadmium resistance protein CzcA
MLKSIIEFSVRNRLMVMLMVIGLISWGVYSLQHLAIDAVPDITNNQVQVVTVSPTLSPQEVEQFITYPLELGFANLQEVHEIRSISRYGLSVITIVFDDDMPILQARQIVAEKLQIVTEEIPPGLGKPELMPVTTGLGEIYQYTLDIKPGYENQYNAMDLRTIQDWLVKRQMSGISGIVEVSSFGGFLKQYEVSPDPLLMRAQNIELKEIFDAMHLNNENTGGGYIERGSNAFYIRAEGLMKNASDIENTLLKNENGIPVFIKDIAKVKEGYASRFGALTKDGKGETVGGITLMLKGANSSDVMKKVHERVAQVQENLPEGIELNPYLDRSVLVEKVMSTVSKNLLEGGLIVIFILVLMLGNLRAGIIVATVIPLSMLFAISMMRLTGVSANLMSLGAIDFGLIVDGAVIIVESILHNLHYRPKGSSISKEEMNLEVIGSATKLSRSAIFGQVIILIVYLPILALTGIEGKMFSPMAMTVSYAIIGALILSLTYVPMMASFGLSRKIQSGESFADKLMNFLLKLYKPSLQKALQMPRMVIGVSLAMLIASLILFARMGGEFIPNLEEGDLAMQMAIPPGNSLTESIQTASQAEKILLDNFPEVKSVVSKIGTAEVPTDPMAIEDADIMILLKPKEEWVSATNRESLANKMKEKLSIIPGVSFEFTQPIQLRFNELLTGAKADVSVKIYGENLDSLFVYANRVANIVSDIKGAADIKVEQTEGLPQLVIKYNRDNMARYGISIEQANMALRTAMAGEKAGVIFENEKRFDLVVRLPEHYRKNLSELSRIFIKSAQGQQIPFSEIAAIETIDGPMLISRDNTKRRINIGINVRQRDVKSLVAEIQQKLNVELKLPPGYTIHYGGQFENLEAAVARLRIAVPVSLMLIFLLLYFTFGSVSQAAIIFSAIPLAAIGGIAALTLRGMPFSISAGIGFIALFGVAVLNGIVMLNYFNHLKEEGMNVLHDRIIRGASSRLRPVLMTAAVASLGFLPMALSTSNGGEVQRPLATVVIGGLITATLLTLLVLPVVYSLVESGNWKKLLGRKKLATLTILLSATFNVANAQSEKAIVEINIEEAIQVALTNNPEIKNATLKVEASQALKKSAYTLGATDVSLQRGQINYSEIDNYWTITQDFGNLFEQAAKHSYLKEQQNYFKAQFGISRKQLIADVRMVYFEWLTIVQKLALFREQQEHFSKAEKVGRLRYESGAASLISSLALQNLSKEMELEIQQLKADSLVLLQSFNYLLFSDTFFVPYNIKSIVGIEGKENIDATENHPLIQTASVSKTLALKNLHIEKSRFAPSFNGGYFNQSLERIKGFQGFQVGLSVPLWFVPNSSQVKAAKLNVQAAENELEYTRLKVSTQAIKLQAQIKLYRDKLAYYQNTGLPNADKLTEKSELLYSTGEIGYIEFIQNLQVAFKTRNEYTDALKSYYQLYTTTLFFTE